MKIVRRLALLLLLMLGCAGTLAPDAGSVLDPGGAPEAGSAKLAEFAVTVTGEGPPVILVPGLASAGQVWDGVVADLRGTHACHVLTLAGFAGVPAIAAPVLDQVREALGRYIVDRQLVRPVVVGHSLGGFVALDLAAKHPELLGSLLIVDSFPFLPAASDPQATPDSVRPRAEALRRQFASTPAAELEAMERRVLGGMIRDPDKIELALGWFMRSDLPTVGESMMELMTTDLRPALGRIQSRVRVIGTWIAYAPQVTRAQTEAEFAVQYAGLPGAEIVMADQARHFVMFDDLPFLLAQVHEVLDQP
jgi:N-formylmaleamate deformylase